MASDLVKQLEAAGLMLFPTQISETQLTMAQGAILDMSWDAVECFSARLAELHRLTRADVATRIEQLEAQRSQEWVDEAMRLADSYAAAAWCSTSVFDADTQGTRAALLAHLTGETK